MESLRIATVEPSPNDLRELRERASACLQKLTAPNSETRKPLFFEFAGCPKAGKTTVIGIVGHFFKRTGYEILLPAEGASLRTPPTLKDDLLAFNIWSGCYALRNILEDAHTRYPADLVLLDRGLFDCSVWMRFLEKEQHRISDEDHQLIQSFFSLELWRDRELAVFLFTADHETSLKREVDNKLTDDSGSVMNPTTLQALREAYLVAAKALSHQFEVFHIDTSYSRDSGFSFSRVSYAIANKIIDIIENLVSQHLLVVDRVDANGFIGDTLMVTRILDQAIRSGNPKFLPREQAEESNTVQQLVPYTLLRNPSGKYFFAKRKADHSRAILRNKSTILVGGHAERRDWVQDDPPSVFERCLRRELDEELVGIQIMKITRLGVIADYRTSLGSRHLAVLYLTEVGGNIKVRRQATDQEFGREPVEWKDEAEISGDLTNLDPWSQIAASALFNVAMPTLPNEPSLFLSNPQA